MSKKSLPYGLIRQGISSITSKNPILTPEIIQDSRDGVRKRQYAKKVAQENILEGNNTKPGQVVAVLSEDAENNESWIKKNILNSFFGYGDGGGTIVKEYICYIPEVHLMFENPLDYFLKGKR